MTKYEDCNISFMMDGYLDSFMQNWEESVTPSPQKLGSHHWSLIGRA